MSSGPSQCNPDMKVTSDSGLTVQRILPRSLASPLLHMLTT